MKFLFDVEGDKIPALLVVFKDGTTEDYDPVISVELKQKDNSVVIKNKYHEYSVEKDKIERLTQYTRTPIYDREIDVTTYVDMDYETIWENKDE